MSDGVNDQEQLRARHVEEVSSNAPRKLIIAGPGTGKTFTFRKVLEAKGDSWLALTFIRNLVFDLLGKPRTVGEAVIVHEVVHLKVPYHGPVFRSLERAYLASTADEGLTDLKQKDADGTEQPTAR